jgi:hypothetical protein
METRLQAVSFQAGAMMGFFFFNTAFRLVLELTQPPIQWIPGVFSPAVKWSGL